MPMRRSAAHDAPVTETPDPLEDFAADPALAQSLGYQIRYAYRMFVRTLADELAPYRVTTGQWSALRVLWREEGLSQVELAQRMMVEKASLTSVLKAMEASRLIIRRRNAEDRRKLNISLTAAGRRLKSKVFPLVGKINRRATRRLSAEQVHQLQALLSRVMMNLQD